MKLGGIKHLLRYLRFGTRGSVLSQEVLAELERAERVALTRYRDAFFTNSQSGHNVGADELEALLHIRTIDRSQGWGERDRAYLRRLQRAALAAKSHYVESAEDPDGYGAATFNEMLRWLERRAAL